MTALSKRMDAITLALDHDDAIAEDRDRYPGDHKRVLTMADHTTARFYGKLHRGRRYDGSVVDVLASAPTPDDLWALYGEAVALRTASPASKRKWERVAQARAAELEALESQAIRARLSEGVA